MKKILKKIANLPKWIAVFFIVFYQKTLSPDHGLFKARFPYGYCRHYPSCSEYSKRVLLKHGLFKGLVLAFLRILRCNPWAKPQISHNI